MKRKLRYIDFRDGNANIWIRCYQKEKKQKGRKHFINNRNMFPKIKLKKELTNLRLKGPRECQREQKWEGSHLYRVQ